VTNTAGWHSVVVVNYDNGQQIWQCVDCFASDVAIDQDTVYAIRSDGSLIAFDLKTGQPHGIIQLQGGNKMEPLNTQYSIAAADGRVLLYFEDSQEIIALGR
jgi:outer membrane protein assembly factor BamB